MSHHIGGKVVFFKSWTETSIDYVQDLLSDNGEIKSFAEMLQNGLKHTDWFRWQSITRIIKNIGLYHQQIKNILKYSY